ncbi:MAG: hypothetical protein ACKOYQ_05400 [Actinomycetota bacterium]
MSEDISDPGTTGAPLPPLDPELAAWFAAAPAPPMPPQVWQRIEAALSAQPPFTPGAEAPGTVAATAAAPVVDLAAHREKRRSRVLPVLAGAAGVVLVGAVVIPAMRAGNAPTPVADSAGGSPASVVAEANPAEAPAVSSTAAPMPRMMVSTGTDYASAQMPDQVAPLLATVGLTDAAAVATMTRSLPTDVAPVGDGGFTASAESLADCMGRLGMVSDGVAPLLVDRATYDGSDVGVVVSVESTPASPSDPVVLDVVVVGSECSEADVASAERFEVTVAP